MYIYIVHWLSHGPHWETNSPSGPLINFLDPLLFKTVPDCSPEANRNSTSCVLGFTTIQ